MYLIEVKCTFLKIMSIQLVILYVWHNFGCSTNKYLSSHNSPHSDEAPYKEWKTNVRCK